MREDERETARPSLMTPREQTEFHTANKNMKEIPGLLDRLAVHGTALGQVRQELKWTDEHRARVVAEIEALLFPDVDALKERAVQAATRDLDQEEGELRAGAGFTAEVDAGVAARSQMLSTQVASADTRLALDTFEDAVFTGNLDLVRAVGAAVLSRLRTLAAVDKGKDLSDARTALLLFEQRWADWRRANPSPRERLAQIERERANRRVQVEETARLILRLHGVGRPAAPPPTLRTMPTVVESTSQLREGPNFDVFGDRLPGRVRR